MTRKGAKVALTDKTVDDLLKAMLVFARAVNHGLETQAVKSATSTPLSSSKVQVLRLLAQRGKQTSTQVARFLGVTKPAVSQIINSMVRSRLVTRRPTTQDRREVALQLTRTGRAQFAGIRRAQRQLLRRMMRGLPRRTATECKDLLGELAASIAQVNEGSDGFCFQCGAHADDTCILVGGDASCLYLRQTTKTSERHSRSAVKA